MKRFALSALAMALATTNGLTLAENLEESPLNDEELERIEVVGHKREYLDSSAKSALGLELELLKTPAAISVVSQDLLKDLQVNNVDEALRNVAGVTRFKTGNGGEERFSIRGFFASNSIYKDGVRNNNRLNVTIVPSTETANIERIEVLKGPSALLYGEGEPGGFINYITKRPQNESYTNIEVLGGSDSFRKIEFDSTGAITDETLAYRLVGSYEDSESFQDEMGRKRLLLNPSISFTPSDDLDVLVRVEYLEDDYTQSRGYILDGDFFSGYFVSDLFDESTFFGIPGFNDQTEADTFSVQAVVNYYLSDDWRIEATYSYAETDKLLFDAHPTFITQTFGLIGPVGSGLDNLVNISGANSSDGNGESKQYTLKSFYDFDGPFNTRHNTLVSITREELFSEARSFFSPDSVFFNVVTGDYFFGDPFTPIAPEDIEITLIESGEGDLLDFQETGVNIVDYIEFNDQFSVLLGARYSDYQDNFSDFSDDNVSFRAGLNYSYHDQLSFYLSVSEGYTSSAGRLDLQDEPIDPETSLAWEIGAKWEAVPARLLLTGALYQIEKKDIAFIANPLAPPSEFRYGNLGAVESRGLELEAVGNITDNWRVHASYSYIDTEITDGGVTGAFGPVVFLYEEGNEQAGIGDHNLSISSFYEFDFGLGRLGFGGSLFHMSESFASLENNLVLDEWTEVDIAAYYKWDKWKIQLNVRNVFDEEYSLTQELVNPDGFAAIRAGKSAPRTFIASVSYEF